MISDVTIIIPTYNNRHNYLKRSLAYHAEFRILIIIADSSSEPLPDSNFKNQSNIRYFHLPTMGYTEKLQHVLSKVTTPYTLLLADDDFITKRGIISCLQFLHKHPDYDSAQGNQIFFEIKNKKINSYPLMSHLVGFEINDDSPSERVRKLFLQHIYLHYSVNKTENIAKVYSLASSFKDDFIGGLIEYFLNIISIINGKHKVLPVFYSARESTSGSAISQYFTPSELKKSEKYSKQYAECLDMLSLHLSTTANIPLEKAQETIDEAFHASPYFNDNKDPIASEILQPLQSLPFLKKGIDHLPFSGDLKRRYSKLIKTYRKYKYKSSVNEEMGNIKKKKISGFPYSDRRSSIEWKNIKNVIHKHSVY